MKDYAIFVDSSADYDASRIGEGVLRVVPMSCMLGDEERMCGCMIEPDLLKTFYDGQRKGGLTHTAHASPQQYIDAFEPALKEGLNVLYISLSGGLTNFMSSVNLAAEELSEDYPDAVIRAVDSLSASGGIGLLAELALKNREAGMALEENAAMLDQMAHRICHLFMVDDLMYLKRGGRIPMATALIGTALDIHPILVIADDGTLKVVTKKRGRKFALRELLARYEESRDPAYDRLFIIHADAAESAEILKEQAGEATPEAVVSTAMLTPIIGAHTGPGLAAYIYFGDRDLISK